MATTFPAPNYVNPETRVPELLGVQISLTTFAFLIVLGRVFTRVKIVGFWGADDVAISVGMIMAIVETTLGCMATRYGTGLHIWDVPPNLSLAPALKMSFVVQILYMPILLTTKVSILLFYFRLSPNALYRKIVKIVLCFSIAFGIAVTGADIFQCTPVAFMFDATIPGGKCINQMLFFKSTAIINIINDFVVFILPLPTLWRLKLPNAQKVALCFILSLGIFVCIASCLRLSLLFRLSQTNDVTWFGVDLSNWSCIEYNVGIICASLPALKPLMTRLLPTVFGRSTAGSAGNSGFVGSARKSSNMYALGSVGDREHYRGAGDFSKPDYGVAVLGRSDDLKDNESEEHIIDYGAQGITKTMDIMVDVEERSRSGSTVRENQV